MCVFRSGMYFYVLCWHVFSFVIPFDLWLRQCAVPFETSELIERAVSHYLLAKQSSSGEKRQQSAAMLNTCCPKSVHDHCRLRFYTLDLSCTSGNTAKHSSVAFSLPNNDEGCSWSSEDVSIPIITQKVNQTFVGVNTCIYSSNTHHMYMYIGRLIMMYWRVILNRFCYSLWYSWTVETLLLYFKKSVLNVHFLVPRGRGLLDPHPAADVGGFRLPCYVVQMFVVSAHCWWTSDLSVFDKWKFKCDGFLTMSIMASQKLQQGSRLFSCGAQSASLFIFNRIFNGRKIQSPCGQSTLRLQMIAMMLKCGKDLFSNVFLIHYFFSFQEQEQHIYNLGKYEAHRWNLSKIIIKKKQETNDEYVE